MLSGHNKWVQESKMSCPRIINHYFTVGKNQQINNQIKQKKQ